jgi:hypothetical protein
MRGSRAGMVVVEYNTILPLPGIEITPSNVACRYTDYVIEDPGSLSWRTEKSVEQLNGKHYVWGRER